MIGFMFSTPLPYALSVAVGLVVATLAYRLVQWRSTPRPQDDTLQGLRVWLLLRAGAAALILSLIWSFWAWLAFNQAKGLWGRDEVIASAVLGALLAAIVFAPLTLWLAVRAKRMGAEL